MNNKQLIVGARGSELSLVQADIIKTKLQEFFSELSIIIKIVKTTGDKNMDPIPLDSVGKGWFTKELDRALLDGSIDMAVHSLKDLPEELPEELIIAAIPQREDAREAFVSSQNIPFLKLKKGAIIGTDSTRRKVQIMHKRKDITVKSIRGNVNTRLKKLADGEYDGVFLAVAGIKRLGKESVITEYFDTDDMIPSPGQGALAVVIKKENKELFKKLQKLSHEDTVIAVKAERAFSKVFGGGCKTPVGAYAQIKNKKIHLRGFVGSLYKNEVHKALLTGKSDNPEAIGEELANEFINKGYTIDERPQFVVITRPQNATIKMQKQIESLGLQTYFYPSIAITKDTLTKNSQHNLSRIDSFDWIVFTSQNGVRFFIEDLTKLGISLESLKNKKIAAVGKKTAEVLMKYHLQVDFVPTKFTTETLALEFPEAAGKKIFMARANLASSTLKEKLEERGAIVTDIAIYKTSYLENNNPEFDMLVQNRQIYCITFTSPSTVTGFLNNIKTSSIRNEVFNLKVLSIGPVTTKALQQEGFKNIITADMYTINGMIAKLKESIL